MQKITLLTVGKLKFPWIADGCDLYKKRLEHESQFSWIIQKDGDIQTESKALYKTLSKAEGVKVLLDERGKQYSSEELAKFLANLRDRGEPVTFVVGGAYGVGEEVKKMCSQHLSLGKMTLPHELAQLLLLEQLYRACSINRGAKYHHG